MGRYVALGDVTVHKLLTPETEANKDPGTNNYPCASVTLVAGESLDEKEVPYYVRESHKAGQIPLLELVTEAKAKTLAKKAEEERVLAENSLPSAITQTGGDATSSGPGRVADAPSAVEEVDGQILFVSGDNSGYGQDGTPQSETVEM